MLNHRNIFQLMRHYIQWDDKLPSTRIIPIRHIVMVCYWSHWMMQDFFIHAKLYRILQNRKLEMVPKSTIDYIKYLETEMEADQSIKGRTIPTNCLYSSIESINWLLVRDIATVGTLQKGRSGHQLNFLTLKTERFLVQLLILKRRRRTFA